MDRLAIISESLDRAGCSGSLVAPLFEFQTFTRRSLPRAKPPKYVIVDINLEESSHLSDLKQWLGRRSNSGKAIFAVDRGVHRQTVQAYAIGATDLVDRPIDRKILLKKLFGDIGSFVGETTAVPIGNSDGISAGVGALQSIFASAVSGTPINLKMVDAAGETVVSHIAAEGLVRWIDTVRKHHSQTYQHCLLVTGVAVTFGRHLGFSSADKQRLAFAGLLHDIGKAGVPIDLLEKPGPLDGDEVTVMKQHPMLGFEALRGVQGLDPEMLDMVVHHHEYLDGSGYPHGLDASKLSDLVRMMTIADVFGALIERRAYREPMSCEAAYEILEKMGPKLDTDLVRELRPFARVQIR